MQTSTSVSRSPVSTVPSVMTRSTVTIAFVQMGTLVPTAKQVSHFGEGVNRVLKLQKTVAENGFLHNVDSIINSFELDSDRVVEEEEEDDNEEEKYADEEEDEKGEGEEDEKRRWRLREEDLEEEEEKEEEEKKKKENDDKGKKIWRRRGKRGGTEENERNRSGAG